MAEPARLLIVDTLRTGDATPGELARILEMPSNLLAHHLNVLQSEGLTQRHRSEGDRRRSYISLNAGVLDLLTPTTVRQAARVLFVCTANSARSHLAAALWRRASHVPAASAGTHPADAMHPGAVATAKRHELPLPRRRPQHVNDVRTAADYVITVCDSAHEELDDTDLHWSIPDPVRIGSPAEFDRAYQQLAHRIDTVSAHIRPSN